MKLALYRNDYGHELSRVNKILKDKYGRLIGIAAENPILDTRMYKVEYAGGYKTVMTSKTIASNLFTKSTKTENVLYYSTQSYICVLTANRSRRETLLSICPMETRVG